MKVVDLLKLGIVFSVLFGAVAKATPIVYTLSTDSEDSFYAYNPITDQWSQKASFSTNANLAVDKNGDVFGLSRTGVLSRYDSLLDSWVSIAGGGLTSDANLEVLNDGRFFVTGLGQSTYNIFDGSQWSTGNLGFTSSQNGDYDPFTNTLVLSENGSSASRLINVNDFSSTRYGVGATFTGEIKRAGALLNGIYYQKWGTNDLFAIDLADVNSALFSVGDGPNDLWYPSAAADRENNLIYLGGIGSGRFDFEVFDPTTRQFTDLSDIPSGLGFHSSMVVGGVSVQSKPIPEPSALALIGLGLAGLAVRRRIKK
ncbi:PEP-CTERM sorting domain-containing protein [Alteromonas genovensis]|uniref:PEP-CTERM sorting domain-containing protein n=1 Tax=Alteromonas genovensis TaxID=471225 RepID=UPI002FE10F84